MVSNLYKEKGIWKFLEFFKVRSCIQEEIKQYGLKQDKASMASVPKLDLPYSSIMEILFREEDI